MSRTEQSSRWNAFRVLARDLKRLAKAPAAWLVILFLVSLPSLYAWLNIYAFWSPYEHASDLKVCVVNQDRGTDNAIIGHLDVGDEVVAELEDNHELDWEFVTYDQAMDQINSGVAFAVFVIPDDFSSNIATLFSPDFKQPKLEYYVNEKEGPIGPKITDVGATTLDNTINDAFFSTVSSTIAKTLKDKIARSEVSLDAAKGSAARQIADAMQQVDDARSALDELVGATDSAISRVDGAKGRLARAQDELANLASGFDDISRLTADSNAELVKISGELNTALDSFSTDLARVSRDLSLALADTSTALGQAEDAARAIVPAGSEWAQSLEALDRAVSSSLAASEALNDQVSGTLSRVDAYRKEIATQTVPALSRSLMDISRVSSQLSATVTSQKTLVDQSSLVLDQLKTTLAASSTAMERSGAVLDDIEGDLGSVKTDLAMLQASNAIAELFGTTELSPSQIASFMQSPTQLVTEELYPLNSFGSAMAPLFINLTLWIGVFMLMVIMHLEVDAEGIPGLTITQRFFGRLMLLALPALCQAIVCCTGCLVLGVQTENAFMFYLSAMIASMAYLCVQYTLSVMLQHVGKALCVILVFMQIPGASGLYPIEMIPEFYQTVYPFFPFTYSIDALRETICGFYGSVWIHSVLMLLVFAAIFIAIGVLVRPYLTNLNRLFTRELSESGLLNVEAVQLPARRWRMSQLLSWLFNQDEYRQRITRRVMRFIKWYPQLKRGIILVGLACVAALTAVLGLLSVEKPIILTTWLVWFVLMIGLYTALEYFKDNLSHVVSLDSMNEEQVRALFDNRERYTAVQPVRELVGDAGGARRPYDASKPRDEKEGRDE